MSLRPSDTAMKNENRLAAAAVLYHPDATLLLALRDALLSSGTPLIVVCNSVLDADLKATLTGRGMVTLIGDGTNPGLGAALNAAMEAAESAGFTHVMLFDQDSSPGPELARALLDRADAVADHLGALGPWLTPPPGEGYKAIWYSFRSGGSPGARHVDFLPTSGSLIPVSAWRRIGPFRADFFIDGIDVEWSFRAWKAGYRMILADDLAMIHRWGQPGGQGRQLQIARQGPLRNAYHLRNSTHSLRLAHVPWRWKLRLAPRLAAQTLALCLRGEGPGAFRAIRAGWRGELGAIR